MPDYIVLKDHDTNKGVVTKGQMVGYSEFLGNQLVKKGIIGVAPKLVIQTPPKVQPPKNDIGAKMVSIDRKRTVKPLLAMLEVETDPDVIKHIEKRIKDLG